MSDEAIALLRNIDATLKELLTLSKTKRAAKAPDATVADDVDLDSQYGDEQLRAKMPRDWSGDDYKGSRMSNCPPELLEMIADRCDYFAQQNDEKGEKDDQGRPKSFYDRRTARRARGWAARLRRGWKSEGSTDASPSKDEIAW